MYGSDINANRKTRDTQAIRAKRCHIVQTHTPSTIEPGQTLQVRFPNLGENDVIVPGSFFISFELKLMGIKDKARSVVPNIGRKIIKSLKIRFQSHDVQTINNYDEVMTYFDQWLSKKDKSRRIYQGIHTASGLKLRVGSKDATGDVEETAIAKTLGSRFRIPIDFELLNHIGPYHQHSLADKLEIELTFNDAKAVILGSTAVLSSAADRDYNYSVSNIRAEWDQITDPVLAGAMATQYQMLALPFTRILMHPIRPIAKSDSVFSLKVNVPSKSLTHILILAIDENEDRKPFAHKEVWKNLDITKVDISIEAQPNQLYAKGLLKENTWSEIVKLFHANGVSMGAFLTEKYALCLDLRPSIDETIHGNGVQLQNTVEGLTIEISRVAGTSAGKLKLHVFILQDAQLNIVDGRFLNIEQ